MKYTLHCGAATAVTTIYDDTCKTSLNCSDSKQKNKDTIAAFLFHLYDQHITPTKGIISEVIRSNGFSSELEQIYYAPYEDSFH